LGKDGGQISAGGKRDELRLPVEPHLQSPLLVRDRVRGSRSCPKDLHTWVYCVPVDIGRRKDCQLGDVVTEIRAAM
jgi:hypothetical protein